MTGAGASGTGGVVSVAAGASSATTGGDVSLTSGALRTGGGFLASRQLRCSPGCMLVRPQMSVRCVPPAVTACGVCVALVQLAWLGLLCRRLRSLRPWEPRREGLAARGVWLSPAPP